jgi:uncharacterized protein (UPF0297 family)
MENMINNLINGNISDAKKQAKRHTLTAIYNYLIETGYDEQRAMVTASFLKNETDFQTYCDETID